MTNIACIVCSSGPVDLVLDLGTTALANKFLSAEELATASEPNFPLRVGFCIECGHVQLMDRIPPAAMFEDYLYMSGASSTLVGHFQDIAETMTKRLGLGNDDMVLDIGCNDASLLLQFRKLGIKTLGIDPAANLAEYVKDLGVDRITDFFGSASADRIVKEYGQVSLVTTTNTFPHIPDLGDFVAGIKKVLADDGTFMIEAHYLVDILEQVAFDTVYHEHVSYWSLKAMIRLFEDNGLQVVRAERLPIHHGQLRVSVMHPGHGVDESVAAVLAAETALGVGDINTYHAFAEKVSGIKRDLKTTIAKLRASGAKVAGYGAPAKGMTLLEYVELGPKDIDFIADKSPLKQGRFTPGSHIPIVATDQILEDQPEYLVLFAWNFAEEILAQQQQYRDRGGKFIVPVPEVRVIE